MATITTGRRAGCVETTIVGPIDPPDLERMVGEYRVAPTETWIIRGEAATNYGPKAIQSAVTLFAAARASGLRRIIAVLTSPIIRMGARTVSMSLRIAKSGVSIVVVETLDEGLTAMREPIDH